MKMSTFSTIFLNEDNRASVDSKTLTDSVQTIIAAFKDNQAELLGLISYSGFDVQKFRLKLVDEKHVTNEELVFCVMVFMVRGNNITRILESTRDEEVKSQLASVRRKLDIKNSAAGKTTHVTLSRIAIAFPELTALLLDSAPDMPGAVSLDLIRRLTGYAEYPAVARQSSLACFLPLSMGESEGMLSVFFFPNLILSETINRGKKEWKAMTENEKAETTMVYQMNAWNSTLFTDDERFIWCRKLGILVLVDKTRHEFTTVWKEAKKAADRQLSEKYSFAFGGE